MQDWGGGGGGGGFVGHCHSIVDEFDYTNSSFLRRGGI